jgi:integrase/recombinase XerD
MSNRKKHLAHQIKTMSEWKSFSILSMWGDKPVDEVTTDDLRRTMASVQSGSLGPTSIFHIWKAIRAFYKWSEIDGLTGRPDKPLSQPKFQLPEIVPFSSDEIKALLNSVEHTVPSRGKKKSFTMRRPLALRDRTIILMLLDTGLRASELCRLKISDVDLQGGSVSVRPFRSGIKSRARVLPLGQATRKSLWRYMATRKTKSTDPVFATLQGGELDRADLYKVINRAGDRAKIQNVYPHRFRHTFAIQFLRNGGDVFTLQRLLGHASLSMVRHYLNLAQSDDEAAHRKASPVDNRRL